ncbi:ABC transporter ATP-binding protein [Corynebacterium phocae]|uniref:ABC transporter ATP-binding protein n=1 Tax=Corynebacterium phocae TaxID=161895 RepID=A0A1L7D1T9_9CORY|nr:anchored repeat-type ABC transporter ATP-binding subunit [Corynebacterium phocae]APT91931.1 ABC transporter ATP-binding protein [Corynebacterium phocae]KAA8726913.1 anchored repeat-type ABC transporter ATP-binding subunit [Corynebacterium phocae]
MAILNAKNLGVTLAGRQIFSATDFQVDAGEFIGLIGPNGAGKTTLMRAILGLIPSTGTVEVGGHSDFTHIRRQIGYVPQRHEFAWDFPMSIAECVGNGRIGMRGFFGRAGKADREAVDEALARVDLTDLRARPIGQLSGGQRQRVLVARALSTRPKVLLLDEPFTGLDMPTAEALTALFEQLAAQGTAIVMSTHDLGEALNSCSRLVLFRGGICADGPPPALANPQIWMDTFQVSNSSPLLTLVGAHIK